MKIGRRNWRVKKGGCEKSVGVECVKWSVRVIVCVLEELRGGSSREKGIK